MQLLKYFLITMGIISITLFIILLFIGVKVVSIIVFYVVGALAIIALICFAFFYAGKLFGKNDNG